MARSNYQQPDSDHVYSYKEIEGYPVPVRRSRSIQEKGSITLLMAAAAGLLVVDISVHQLVMSSLMFLTAIILAIPKEANKLLTNFEKLQRRMGINLYGILFAVLAVVFMLDFAIAPADAQFMNNAETWLSGAIDGIDATIVTLFFNVLRGLFLMYLGVSLIRIVNAARQDEDWQQLARTPLIIVVTVVVGDLLATLVTGA